MELAVTPAAMTKILDVGFDKEYGARPLRRAITSVVDDNLSEALLRGVIAEGDTAVIDFDPDVDARDGVPVEDEGTRTRGFRARGGGRSRCGGDPDGVVLFGADFEVDDESIYKPGGVAGRSNVVSRGPVPANDVVA